MKILGLNSAGFNTSAALIVDGVPVFAVAEECLIREKRTRRFPVASIQAALNAGGLRLNEIDAIAVSWNPGVNLESFNASQSRHVRYLGEILYNVPNHLIPIMDDKNVTDVAQQLRFIGGDSMDIRYITHHMAHAAAFFFSPFDDAAVLTADSFGEKQSTTFCEGKKNQLKLLWDQEFPHALGSFYSAFTEYCGFTPQGDEWKLMGASPYGNPDSFYEKVSSLIRRRSDGGFELDLKYFNHFQFHRPSYTTPKMVEHLGLPANGRDVPLNQDYYDLAAAAQKVFEDVYFHLLKQLHERTGNKNVVISGGCALNSVANGKIIANTPFKNIFIPPIPDDSGGSLGAAYYLYSQIMGNRRTYTMDQNYLGPGYDDLYVLSALQKYRINYRNIDTPARKAAEMIADGKIIGWVQGRLEFGDRALGNRSILADPRDAKMKDKVNETIKYREGFRPFAPAIMAERMNEYFPDAQPTPFMEKVFSISPECRNKIPAVTHIDGSGRLQTVSKEQNALFHDLIEAFDSLTGVPIVLNTSFNLKGEAMVCSPEDALRTYITSGLDALFIGSYLIEK